MMGVCLRYALFGCSLALMAPSVCVAQTARPYAIDSAGNILGPLVAEEFGSVVFLRLKPTGDVAPVQVKSGGFGSYDSLFYKSADCSGQPYIRLSYYGIFVDAAFVDKTSIFYADVGATYETIQVQSYLSDSNGKCQPGTYAETVRPAKKVPIDAQGFAPPFRLVSH